MNESIRIEYMKLAGYASLWSWTIWHMVDGVKVEMLHTDDSATLEQAKTDALREFAETGWEKDVPEEVIL